MVRKQASKTNRLFGKGESSTPRDIVTRIGRKVGFAPSSSSGGSPRSGDSSHSSEACSGKNEASLEADDSGSFSSSKKTKTVTKTNSSKRILRLSPEGARAPAPDNRPALSVSAGETPRVPKNSRKSRLDSFRKAKQKLAGASSDSLYGLSENGERVRPRTMAPLKRSAMASAMKDMEALDDSSYDLSIEASETEVENSESEVSESTGGRRSRKNLLRRIVHTPSSHSYREDLSRLSLLNSNEKEIEYARKLLLRGMPDLAVQKLDTQYKLLSGQERPTNRETFAQATALFLRSKGQLALSSFTKAEVGARQALAILDNLIVAKEEESLTVPPTTERRRGLAALSDNWLTGQELSLPSLWLRKSAVENQLGLVIWQKDSHMSAVEWFQRSIYSREQRAQAEGLAQTHISLAEILVHHAKIHFKSFKELGDVSLVHRLELFRELNELLGMARASAKNGIKLCKRSAEDAYAMIGLSVQLEVMVMHSQLSALEAEHLVVKPHIFRCEDSSYLDLRRHEKMEMLRREIEKVQRRINKEKNKGSANPFDVSILSPNPDIPQIHLPTALSSAKSEVIPPHSRAPPSLSLRGVSSPSLEREGGEEGVSEGEEPPLVSPGRSEAGGLGRSAPALTSNSQDIFDMQITM